MAAFPTNLGHVLPVAAHGVPALATNVGHVLPIFADGRPAFSSDLGHVLAVAAHGLSTLAADLRHVAPIAAHGETALSSRLPSFLGSELMGSSTGVGGFSPLACDLALPLSIHRGETARGSIEHGALLRDSAMVCRTDMLRRRTRATFQWSILKTLDDDFLFQMRYGVLIPLPVRPSGRLEERPSIARQ
jgi:hypothetical protein